MKFKYKITAVVLIVMLCMTGLIYVNANNSLTPKIKGNTVMTTSGNTVDIVFFVENNPGITSLVTNFTYDTDALSLISVKDESLFDGAGFVTSKEVTQMPFKTIWSIGTKDSESDGKLVTLTFNVKDNVEPGLYEIGVSYDEEDVYNTKLEDVYFETVNGYVNVISEIVSTPSLTPITTKSAEPESTPTGSFDTDKTAEPTPSAVVTPSLEPTPSAVVTPSLEPTPSVVVTPSLEPTPSAVVSPSISPIQSVTPSPSEKIILGDLNGDEIVGLPDVLEALKLALGINEKTEALVKAADVDENGEVNLNDVLQILKYSLRIQKEFIKAN